MSTRVLHPRIVAALAAILLLAATSFAVGRATAPGVDTGPGFDLGSPEAMARSFEANLAAAGAIYIKIEGIDGESSAEGHQGWSDVLSFAHPISRAAGSNTGTARQRGGPVHHDLQVSKGLDKSSPKLAEALVSGAVVPTAVIEFVRTLGDGSTVTFLSYQLTDVRLTGYEMSSSVGGVPVDELTLAFSGAVMTYTPYSADGRSGTKVEYAWKVEEGTV